MKATIIYGVSGSGKTTYAEALSESYGGIPILERDKIRFGGLKLGDWISYTPNPEMESMVDVLWKHTFVELCSNGKEFIISDTLCSVRDRINLASALVYLNYEVNFIRMSTSLDECIIRDKNRGGKSVGEDVIRKQWDKLMGCKDHVY